MVETGRPEGSLRSRRHNEESTSAHKRNSSFPTYSSLLVTLRTLFHERIGSALGGNLLPQSGQISPHSPRVLVHSGGRMGLAER